jgi:hypothetical protein
LISRLNIVSLMADKLAKNCTAFGQKILGLVGRCSRQVRPFGRKDLTAATLIRIHGGQVSHRIVGPRDRGREPFHPTVELDPVFIPAIPGQP